MTRQLLRAVMAILAAALIPVSPVSPEVMKLDWLAPEVRVAVKKGQLQSLDPVNARWPTGEFALMFCMRGSKFPTPQNIMAVFHTCRGTSKIFPSGDTS